jgi:predicted enzyme related to lactoylglutathione lyase
MSNNRVVHFEIQADDVTRAKNFYEKVFGWNISQMMKAEDGGMDYYGLKTGADGTAGINGGLYQRPADNKLYTFDCTIQVADLDKAIDAVKKNGGTLRSEKMEIPGVGWFIGGTDTEGNRFGLMQPTEWQAK